MSNYLYQIKAAEQILKNAQNKVSVLAACPGAGKTTISHIIINKFIKTNPNAKVLVLTEGKNTLKNQYLDELKQANVRIDFSYGDFNSSAQVRVGLPQSIRWLAWTEVDLLIVDEAHNFFMAPMVQAIVQKLSPKKTILMTGSPTKFNNSGKYAIYYIAAEELMEMGVFSSISMDVARCSDKKNPWEAIKSVLASAKSHRDDTSKIMIACPSIDYAKKVFDYLKHAGFTVSLSTSENDENDTEIEKFKNDQTRALVVVGKGILGFNDKKITLVADLRSSSNLDASYQLFARALRIHPKGIKKSYYRIADQDYNKQVLTLHKMKALMKKDIFQGFDGKNLKLQPMA